MAFRSTATGATESRIEGYSALLVGAAIGGTLGWEIGERLAQWVVGAL